MPSEPDAILANSADVSPIAFQEALVRGDRRACEQIVQRLVAKGEPVIDLYESYFKPALYAVGRLWESNQLSVASEHLATAIVERLMNRAFPHLLALERQRCTVVLAPAEWERHDIGARMVSDLFEMHGWDAIQLSAGTTSEELVSTARATNADVVGLSISVSSHFAGLKRMIVAVRAAVPTVPIIAGGQGLSRAPAPGLEGFPGVTCFADLFELRSWLERSDAERSDQR